MKSFVCEAQSITLAIEKAWINSGKPVIFSVKIIDRGRNTFFWWHKKPAKIIFFYELSNSDARVISNDVVKSNMKPIIPGINSGNVAGKKSLDLENKNRSYSMVNSGGRRFSGSPQQKSNEKRVSSRQDFTNRQDGFKNRSQSVRPSPNSSIFTKDHVWFVKNMLGFLVKTFFDVRCGFMLDTSEKSVIKVKLKHRFGMRGNGNSDIINSIRTIVINALSSKFNNINFSNCKIVITSLD
jgi:hypothetical protein